jgi:rod shape-determining protein MreC
MEYYGDSKKMAGHRKSYKKQKQEVTPKKTQRLFRPLKTISSDIIIPFIFSLFLLFFAVKNEKISFLIFGEIDNLLNFIKRPFFMANDVVVRTSQLTKERKELIQEIFNLKKKLNKYAKKKFGYKKLKEENIYLKSILPIVSGLDLKTITTIQKPALSQHFVVVSSLPKDIAKNITSGDIVLSTKGVFGKVIYNDKGNISILLITHINSRIPVISTKSRKKAILFGKNCDFLKIKYVKDENEEEDEKSVFQKEKAKFIEGEILETIDTCGFFLKSCPVAKIEKDSNGNMQAKWICSGEQSSFVTIVFRK